MLIVDEVFRLPGDTAFPLRENVVVIGSLSKMYGFPGLRFGWIVASKRRIRRMRTIQQYVSLSLSSFGAALGPIVLQHMDVFARRGLLELNRQVLLNWAKAHEKLLRISRPSGGTTVVLEFRGGQTEDELFKKFLKRKLLLIPGNKFTGTDHRTWFRLGYGCATETLSIGLDRIAGVVN
jgi:DNA-binding transcriptional MocR family regulator